MYYKRAGEGLLTFWDGFNFMQSKVRVDVRKKFFPVRVVRHWHRFPQEAVPASSLEVFKANLGGALV